MRLLNNIESEINEFCFETNSAEKEKKWNGIKKWHKRLFEQEMKFVKIFQKCCWKEVFLVLRWFDFSFFLRKKSFLFYCVGLIELIFHDCLCKLILKKEKERKSKEKKEKPLFCFVENVWNTKVRRFTCFSKCTLTFLLSLDPGGKFSFDVFSFTALLGRKFWTKTF